MERKSESDPDNEKSRKPWWSDEQFPPKPLLNLSLLEQPLIDLKQETNKGEDANLHLITEFENDEIERAKEYEQRAQMWD